MTQYWEPGTYYGEGSVVQYEGHRYKIIQPHTSQSDWTPPITPALWGRLSDHDGGEHHEGHHGHHQPEQQAPFEKPQYGQEQTPNITHEERKTHWYDLDDKRKKELEVGGGLLAAAAAIGAGYYAYHEHEKNEDEKKALQWSLQNWLHEAQMRTADYNQNGPRGPVTWVLTEGTKIPQNAIEVSKEHGHGLYVSRAFYEGTIQVGKASTGFKKGAMIGFADDEIELPQYEILVGDMRGLRWVNYHGKFNRSSFEYQPVEGGRDADGSPLFIIKAYHKDTEHPGKVSESLRGGYITYGGKEVEVKEYEILCYA